MHSGPNERHVASGSGRLKVDMDGNGELEASGSGALLFAPAVQPASLVAINSERARRGRSELGSAAVYWLLRGRDSVSRRRHGEALERSDALRRIERRVADPGVSRFADARRWVEWRRDDATDTRVEAERLTTALVAASGAPSLA